MPFGGGRKGEGGFHGAGGLFCGGIGEGHGKVMVFGIPFFTKSCKICRVKPLDISCEYF